MTPEKAIKLSQWVESYTEELYSWAFYKLSDSEQAKDLVQDTFLAAAEKIDGFKGKSTPKTWLFSIINHKIIDFYRKKVSQPVSIEDQSFSDFFESNGEWKRNKKPQNWQEDNEIQLLDDEEFQSVLKKCINSLPEKWNTCVKLKYLTKKNGQDICQELGMTPSNFWQVIHRAKLQLRSCVEKNWFKELVRKKRQ